MYDEILFIAFLFATRVLLPITGLLLAGEWIARRQRRDERRAG